MQLDSTLVSLQGQASYNKSEMRQLVDNFLSVIKLPCSLHSSRVLLKPNLISASFGPLPCSEKAFILVVADWLLDHGASVYIGDSPAFGSAATALEKLNISAPLIQRGVSIVEFQEVQSVTLSSGRNADIARVAMECDWLFNLPRVKAHQQTGLTLAVKNLFGCLAGFQKPWWHMRYGGDQGDFPDLLIELLDHLPFTITLADGIRGMHKTGPIHGESINLGFTAGGTNPIAVDTAILHILRAELPLFPLWLAAKKAGKNGTELATLTFPFLQPGDFSDPGFLFPEELSPIRFNPFHFMKNSVKRMALRLR